MNNIKLSFDFDGTLSRQIIQNYAKELVQEGFEIHIVTRRYDSIDKYTEEFNKQYGIVNIELEHQYLYDVAKELNISKDKIHFMNMDDKYKFFKDNPDFLWHLDDDWIEINDINKHSKVIGISCTGNNTWKKKCNELIEIYKFNTIK